MSIVGLYLYDHRYSKPTDNVAGVEVNAFIDKLDDGSLVASTMSEASHIIGHFKEQEFNILYNVSNSAPTKSSFQIVFCLTTEGMGFGRDDHKLIEINGLKRYIFYVNNVSNIRRSEVLKSIYSMDQEEAHALLEGDNTKVSSEILSLFNLKTDILCAISILCQGYLATNSKSTVLVVQKALDAMCWDTFTNSSNYAEIIHLDLSKKKTDTQNRSWWLEPFDIDCSKSSDDEILTEINKIHDQIVKEWNEQKYGKVCSCINELIDALKKTTPIADPTIVANAYLAISRRLSQEDS